MNRVNDDDVTELEAALLSGDIQRIKIASTAVCDRLQMEREAHAKHMAKLSRKVARQRRIDERAHAFRKRAITDEILQKRAD